MRIFAPVAVCGCLLLTAAHRSSAQCPNEALTLATQDIAKTKQSLPQTLNDYAKSPFDPAAAGAALGALKGALELARCDQDLEGLGWISLTMVPNARGTTPPKDDHFVLAAPYGFKAKASYRGPADAESQEFLDGAKATIPITTFTVPHDVDLFVIRLKWPDKDTSAPPILCLPVPGSPHNEPCPDTANTASKTQQGDKGKPTQAEGQAVGTAEAPKTQQAKPGHDDCCLMVDAVFLRELKDEGGNLIPAVIITKYNMLVSLKLIEESRSRRTDFPTFVIDGFSVGHYFPSSNGVKTDIEPAYQERSAWAFGGPHYFEVFSPAKSCSPNSDDSEGALTAGFPIDPTVRWVDNGIRPDHPKVYDAFSLRQKLATTATQLAGISGFNPASINAAVGNLQGVTSDISYLSAQVTSVASQSAVTTNTTPSNLTTTTTPATGSTQTTVQTACPPGFIPSTTGTGSSAVTSCTVPTTLPAGTTGTGNASVIQTTTTQPAGSASSSAGATTVANTNTPGSQTVTTNPSISGAIPTAPASAAPAAPTNVGVNASDILTEQVQLNSQITTLEMALQGSLSDQYLVKEGKVVSLREQTTLGMNITLDPPQRYKHAVAEVRVWVYPAVSGDSLSVVNLLPAAKTYNVAKVTSNQKAFGAGVVIDALNVGVAGGKTKNRLYLAKDTDTVAMQYYPNYRDRDGTRLEHPWGNGAAETGRTPQQHVVDVASAVRAWETVEDACVDDPGPNKLPRGEEFAQSDLPLVFGWQFRPVLGADYVQAGQRSVFAQLALPIGIGNRYAPVVLVQTRWREYDEKRQVVGAVYSGSCSVYQDTDPIVVDSPISVSQVYVDDMGGGILKVSAKGKFFQQGFSVMSGPNLIGPAPLDGQHIQFFANAENLLLMDDLKLLAENGQTTSLGIDSTRGKSCGIQTASMNAVPRPDGTSLVEAQLTTGAAYDLTTDKAPQPLFLIGSQVYGLHETPFLEPPRKACRPVRDGRARGLDGISCTYHFVAPTSSLRSAETFKVRDLSWTEFRKSGTVEFDPAFSGLTNLVTAKAADLNNPLAPPKTPPAKTKQDAKGSGDDSANQPPPIYTLSGTDLHKIRHWNCGNPGCIEMYAGFDRYPLNSSNFKAFGKTTAAISFQPKAATPYCTVAKPAPPKGGTASVTLNSTAGALITYSINRGPARSIKSGTSVSYNSRNPTTIEAYANAEGYVRSKDATLTVSGDCKPKPAAGAGAAGSAPAPKLTYASYRFVWHPYFGEPIAWDLPLPPQTDTAASSASSTVLNEGDVTDVTFNNVDVLNDTTKMTFAFNGITLPSPLISYDGTKKTLKFYVTGDMTLKPGHKVIVLNAYRIGADGALQPAQVLLEFDVTKR
jgi:hypothetical protein